jgi:hypothetical protein
MSTILVKPPETKTFKSRLMMGETGKTQGVIAWSSLLFVLLQSVCTFFTALDGLRLVIGIGSLATITAAGEVWDHFHVNWIRVPMMAFAFAGALLNLAILARIRRLRNRPASQWRQVSPTARKLRMERMQLVLAVATLLLIAAEEVTHFRTFHHF